MPENPRAEMNPQAETTEEKPEMCCDGQQTAEEHRKQSPDGKCCIDS